MDDGVELVPSAAIAGLYLHRALLQRMVTLGIMTAEQAQETVDQAIVALEEMVGEMENPPVAGQAFLGAAECLRRLVPSLHLQDRKNP